MLNKLGKLLKYEFLFYFRILPPLYLVMMLTAVIMRFQGTLAGIAFPLLLLVWGGLLLAITIITIILIIQRFIDNFMKDSGALMFTLPVTVWALITSKAVAAFCMVLTGVLTVGISSMLYIMGTENQFLRFLPELNISVTDMTGFVLSVLVYLIRILLQINLIYLAITFSRLLPRFRFPAGCVIYLVVMNFLQNIFRFINKNTGEFLEAGSNPWNFHQNIITGITALAFAGLFFWVTGFLLKRRFNHE